MKILNLESGQPFSMGKGRNWSVLNPDMGALRITLNHGLHAAGQEFTQHIHDESEDVIVVLEGEVDLRQGTVFTPLTAGEAALIPAGEVHGTANRSGRQARLMSFQLPPDQALYRGERNREAGQVPVPPDGTASDVQTIRLDRGSPSFPPAPLVRNVFSPRKGAKRAELDTVNLEQGQAHEYTNRATETVFVLLDGAARVVQKGTASALSRYDVLFLQGEETVTIEHAGNGTAILVRCSDAGA